MGWPVRTSLSLPRFKIDYDLPGWSKIESLTPRYQYLKDPQASYTEKYLAQLDRSSDPVMLETRFRQLRTTAGIGDDVPLVILCFERKPGEWCHRRLWADWWFRRTGEHVPELGALQFLSQLSEEGYADPTEVKAEPMF